MRARGLVLALLFVVAGVLAAWLTGDKSPLAPAPEAKPTSP